MTDSRPVPTTLLSWIGIEKLLPDQKLINAYLWFNRFTNTCGCYEFPRAMATVELCITTDALNEALEDFQRKSLIEYDKDTGEVYVLHWLRFHKFSNVVQQVMYWTAVGKIQSDRLAGLVLERSRAHRIPYPEKVKDFAKTAGYDPTVTVTGTATATATKPNGKRGGIPSASVQRLKDLGYFRERAVAGANAN